MDLSELETQLHEAQMSKDRAIERNAPLEERVSAREAVLEAERALSLAKGEETAITCEWEFLWDPNDPSPHALLSGLDTFLLYRVNESELSKVSLYGHKESGLDLPITALIEFVHCYACRFSNINDEVLTGHPLWGKGLSLYGAYEVIHSQWLAEIQKINAVHYRYDPQRWARLKHYLLIFRDNIFECLTDSYKAEVLRDNLEHGTELARRRLFLSEES